MDNLIAELERATEGNRELDAAIAETVIWPSGRGGELRKAGHAFYETAQRMCERYTTSLDAGKTLARDGWEWRVQSNGLSAVCLPGCDYGDYSKGATPELGFVIALLRARQAMEGAA